jgi:hypothetical protein
MADMRRRPTSDDGKLALLSQQWRAILGEKFQALSNCYSFIWSSPHHLATLKAITPILDSTGASRRSLSRTQVHRLKLNCPVRYKTEHYLKFGDVDVEFDRPASVVASFRFVTEIYGRARDELDRCELILGDIGREPSGEVAATHGPHIERETAAARVEVDRAASLHGFIEIRESGLLLDKLFILERLFPKLTGSA